MFPENLSKLHENMLKSVFLLILLGVVSSQDTSSDSLAEVAEIPLQDLPEDSSRKETQDDPMEDYDLPEGDGLIVGGFNIPIQSVPYMVSIRFKGAYTCGGSLVSRDTVVTAAHCVVG